MRILFCGDVVGRAGRRAIQEHVPQLKGSLKLDGVIVNGENAASGFGMTRRIVEDFFSQGADVVTAGDHCFDKKEMLMHMDSYPNVLRPANLPSKLPGKGIGLYSFKEYKVLVLHLQAQLFMKLQVDCPFEAVNKLLESYTLGKDVNAIVVDFHAEATSEAMAFGHHLDGRVSLVTGSHTHVPTADTQILPRGTAFQTDAGMCGDYDSVIGFGKETSVSSFLNKVRFERLEPAGDEATLCGTYVEIDDKTGLATRVEMVRVGGRLSQHVPVVD